MFLLLVIAVSLALSTYTLLLGIWSYQKGRFKSYLLGILLSIVVLLVILLPYTLSALKTSERLCGGFEPPYRECGLVEFILLSWLKFFAAQSFTRPLATLTVILLIMLFPTVGFTLGHRHVERGAK